jgi:hypothetical protein
MWLSENNIRSFRPDDNAVTGNYGGAAIQTERTQPGLDKAFIKADRFSLNFSDSSGRDLRDGRRILTSRQLSQGANWRREAGFGFIPLSSEYLTLSVTGGLYDARRPANVRQQKLRLGEAEAWRKHRGMDIGLGLKLFGDRLRYDAGYAWSDYIRTEKFSGGATRPNRRKIEESGWQSDDAQRHRIEADILKGKPVDLSASGLYQSGGPSFRKPPRSGMSQPLSIGEISEFGGSFGLDKLRFDIKRQDSDVGGRERQRIDTKVTYRPVTLSMFQQENARVQNGITQRREDTIGGAVKFDLDKYRHGDEEDGGFSIRRLLPSSVSLGAERSRIRYGDDSADPKGVGTGLSLGLYWGWDQADTDISIYRKSRVIGSSTARETDIGLDFSHTIYSGNWDLSAYVSVGSFAHNETDNNFRDLWAAGGVSASYYAEHFPDIALAVDFNH